MPIAQLGSVENQWAVYYYHPLQVSETLSSLNNHISRHLFSVYTTDRLKIQKLDKNTMRYGTDTTRDRTYSVENLFKNLPKLNYPNIDLLFIDAAAG